MRIVDAKHAHAAVNPEFEHRIKLVPKAAPVGRFKIQRINILIFLGRILRILNRSVRPDHEPVRMFRDPRMIRRALECNVQSDLDALRSGCGNQVVEIGERAKLRVNRFVAAQIAGSLRAQCRVRDGCPVADRPRTPWRIRRSIGRVIWPFAERASDGMNRRQINDVKSHGGNLGQLPLDIAERSVLAWNWRR